MLLQSCQYVAGLVGICLSRLFSASGLEREEVGKNERLANSMGPFLQKTNIIHDYLEDVMQGRGENLAKGGELLYRASDTDHSKTFSLTHHNMIQTGNH